MGTPAQPPATATATAAVAVAAEAFAPSPVPGRWLETEAQWTAALRSLFFVLAVATSANAAICAYICFANIPAYLRPFRPRGLLLDLCAGLFCCVSTINEMGLVCVLSDNKLIHSLQSWVARGTFYLFAGLSVREFMPCPHEGSKFDLLFGYETHECLILSIVPCYTFIFLGCFYFVAGVNTWCTFKKEKHYKFFMLFDKIFSGDKACRISQIKS